MHTDLASFCATLRMMQRTKSARTSPATVSTAAVTFRNDSPPRLVELKLLVLEPQPDIRDFAAPFANKLAARPDAKPHQPETRSPSCQPGDDAESCSSLRSGAPRMAPSSEVRRSDPSRFASAKSQRLRLCREGPALDPAATPRRAIANVNERSYASADAAKTRAGGRAGVVQASIGVALIANARSL